MSKLKLGCDPEIFLADAAGVLRSSIGLIGGSKEEPLPLPLGDGYAVQEDNVAVEFNTPAAESREAWDKSIATTVEFLENHVREKYGFHFSTLSAGLFNPEELADPRALKFGCDPDFNVWTGKQNPRPKAVDATLRSCGGHVHVGYTFKSGSDAMRLLKLMDLHLGVGSIILDEGQLRKQLYGKAGAFRTKTYGVEYRTLSNFWIFDKSLRNWVWDNTTKAMEALSTDFDIDSLQQPITEAINRNNKTLAMELIDTYNIGMPA